MLDGEPNPNSGAIDKLRDGCLPVDEDQPSENFFFRAGSKGGAILLDLGRQVTIEINTYSWHPSTRRPQVYKLYATSSFIRDPLGNTFYSEIDVVKASGPQPEPAVSLAGEIVRESCTSGERKYQIIVDISREAGLSEGFSYDRGWYLIKLLPSKNFQPPSRILIVFDTNMSGVAATSGNQARRKAQLYGCILQVKALPKADNFIVGCRARLGSES